MVSQAPDNSDLRQAVRDLQGDAGQWGITPQADPVAESAAAVALAAGLALVPAVITDPSHPALVAEPWPEPTTEAMVDEEDWSVPGVGNAAEGPDVLDDPRAPKMLPRLEVYVSDDDYEANYLEQKLASVTDGATYLGVTWDVVTASGVETIRPLITKAALIAGTNFTASPTTGGSVYWDGTTYVTTTKPDDGQGVVWASGVPTAYTFVTIPRDMLDGDKHTDAATGTAARGDIIVGNDAVKLARLAIGAAARILTSDGTDAAWAAPVTQTNAMLDGSTHTDTAAGTIARGDIITGQGATPKWTRLAKGTQGYVLAMGATEPGWVEPSSAAFQSGMIMLWSGSIATIPTGWVLCDGDNSTPDLRDKFILGAATDSGATPQVDEEDGNHLHGGAGGGVGNNHTTHPTHPDIVNIAEVESAPHEGYCWLDAPDLTHDLHSETDNRPAYYALAFIMKT